MNKYKESILKHKALIVIIMALWYMGVGIISVIIDIVNAFKESIVWGIFTIGLLLFCNALAIFSGISYKEKSEKDKLKIKLKREEYINKMWPNKDIEIDICDGLVSTIEISVMSKEALMTLIHNFDEFEKEVLPKRYIDIKIDATKAGIFEGIPDKLKNNINIHIKE
jgi:hypothetical protein